MPYIQMKGLGMNNNSLYIHVYYSFSVQYFNQKNYLIDRVIKQERKKNRKEKKNKIRVRKII